MKTKATQIHEALERINEDLLTLSDDIWLGIDHNDPEALEAGFAMKKHYNEKFAAFGRLSLEIGELLLPFAESRGALKTDTEASPLVTLDDDTERERVIRELDRHQPHGLREDFRFKRPCGMVLEGIPYPNLNTWKGVYRATAAHMAQKNETLYRQLPNASWATTRRGNLVVAQTPDATMRVPEKFAAGLFFEVNLSANMIRDAIQRLLIEFSLKESEVTFYLREDRDAN